MSFVGDATARPPRCSFSDLRTGETFEMPFTPAEFVEEIIANYADQTVIGMSHEVSQYSNTSSYSIPGLSFEFRAQTIAEAVAIHNGRRFLMSLLYPSEGAASVSGGGPPRVLFFWPQLVSLTCEIRKLRIAHSIFNKEGLTTFFKAEMDFKEVRDFRLTSEEVRSLGTIRAAASQGEFDASA